MRILTVRQPWAWAIIHGGKDVENRKTNIAGGYRGPVAILAARADADSAPEEVWKAHAAFYRQYFRARGVEGEFLPTMRGHIIGVVELVGSHLCVGGCSPWAMPTMPGPEHRDWWHLELTNSQPIEPIPYRGALGLRDLAVQDPETMLRIRAAIA